MNEFYSEAFIQACQKGNVEECKKLLSQGVDINYTDRENQNGLFHAVLNNQLEVTRFLVSNQINMEAMNKDNTTALHIACDKGSKEIVLYLVTNGFDFQIKNGSGQKPGEGTMEMKMFINNLVSEQKAFDVLKQPQKVKLQQIFDDIDTDNEKRIDLHKAIVFNKFVEDNVSDSIIEKDARDFIKTAALCNQHSVNIDEWHFSFSKLYAVDPATYDKFIDDYDKSVEKKGKIRFLET